MTPEQRNAYAEICAMEQENTWKELTSTYAGRRGLWRVLEECGVFATSFSADPYEMAFREGKRNIGLWLIQELSSINPDLFVQMQTEAHDLEAQRQIKAKAVQN